MADSDKARTRPDDLTGTTVGRFNVGQCIGAGGMGEVYRAEDTQLKRTVALKRLSRQKQRGSPHKDDLLKEAQKASALNHPRITGVYDVFTDDGELYLVMEYIDGPTLLERMQTPISVSEFCEIAVQCTEGLAAAHQRGILHGDLKPANIMLTRDKREVKICDFGLARQVSADESSLGRTTVRAAFAGTPAYMAPETFFQAPGDLRSDIFSLGVVFYEMLAGSNPFSAETLSETVDRIRHFQPEPLDRINPAVPAKLARTVQRMIDKNPANRYANAADLRVELGVIQSDLAEAGEVRGLQIRGRLLAAAAGVIVLLALAAPQVFKGLLSGPDGGAGGKINLAVLPFIVSEEEQGRQPFAQGLSETLNQQLSKLTSNRKLQVISVTDIRARKVSDPKDARELLGATMALSGRIQYSGSDARISFALIDTKSGKPLRREVLTARLADPIAVQDVVLEASLRLLGLVLAPQERTALFTHATRQPGAYDYYLQARGYLQNYDRIENLNNAVAVFRKALEIDTRYALAYAGLGEAYWRTYELTKAVVWVEPARGACEGALAIDPNLAEPHACLAMVLNGTGQYEKAADEYALALDREPTNDSLYSGLATAYERLRRPAEAEHTFRRAVDFRPQYWAAYNTLAAYYYRVSRFDDAIAMFQQVVALAPDSFRGYYNLGAAYFMKQRTVEAIESFEKSLAIRPNYAAASNLGTVYYFDGRYERSAETFRKALSIDAGDYTVWGNLAAALEAALLTDESANAYRRARDLAQERLRVNPQNASLHMAMADYDAALGDMKQAQRSLSEVQRLAPADSHTFFQLACFYEFRLHSRNDGLFWLAKAVEQGQTWYEIDHAPVLSELRKDPRFQQLRLEKQGK